MAISFATVMGRMNGRFGSAARFAIKRGKSETADGSSVRVRLTEPPARFDRDGYAASIRDFGGTMDGKAPGGLTADRVSVYGTDGEYIVRGIMANDDAAMTAPAAEPVNPPVDAATLLAGLTASDPAPADAVVPDPVPAARPGRNGRKPAAV